MRGYQSGFFFCSEEIPQTFLVNYIFYHLKFLFFFYISTCLADCNGSALTFVARVPVSEETASPFFVLFSTSFLFLMIPHRDAHFCTCRTEGHP